MFTEKLKQRSFWLSLVAWIGFIIPMAISLIGGLGYLLTGLAFFEILVSFHWFVLFGIVWGIPLIILIYIIFHFLEKKNNDGSQPDKSENTGLSTMPIWLKLVIGFLIFLLIIMPLISYLIMLVS